MNQPNTIRLSISEAAKLFGIDSKTIRRALKNQELRYVLVRGRYKLNFESLLKWSQKKPTVRNKTNKFGLGQYVDKWKINNKHFSPNPETLRNDRL
ncbi:MAG: helix-turn-helix domain-containing protein [Candidatus Parcubacteria bacterium]|nr:helix-turn-helix domain-containing protein [Candidatus Parcubacteria bacterium]